MTIHIKNRAKYGRANNGTPYTVPQEGARWLVGCTGWEQYGDPSEPPYHNGRSYVYEEAHDSFEAAYASAKQHETGCVYDIEIECVIPSGG